MIFPSGVVLFQSKELGPFLAHGRQYRGMSLAYFVTSSQGFICPRHKDKQWETAKSIHVFPFSHSLWAMIVKKGYSVQSSTIFWVTFVVTFRNNTRVRHSVKKFCSWLFRALMKPWDDCHEVNKTHSLILLSMGQNSAQLLCFEKVQHPNKNPGPKTISP